MSLPFKTFFRGERCDALATALQGGSDILIEELWDAPKALVVAAAAHITGKRVLVLTGDSKEENHRLLDLPFFSSLPTLNLPAWETLPHEGVAPSPDIIGERYQALQALKKDPLAPCLVIAGLHSCLQRLIDPEAFTALYLELSPGVILAPGVLAERLTAMGYERAATAADKGEYAVRGGIVDIFPVSEAAPIRLEFWGDEIESLRRYNPVSQASFEEAHNIAIPPAQELELLNKAPKTSTLFSYLGTNTIVIFDDLLSLEDRYTALVSLGCHSSRLFTPLEEFLKECAPYQKIYFSPHPIEELSAEVKTAQRQRFYSTKSNLTELTFEALSRSFVAKRWRHPFATVAEYLLPHQEECRPDELLTALDTLPGGCELHLIGETERELQQLQGRLKVNATLFTHHGYLSGGFAVDGAEVIAFPLTEITHRYKIRRQKLRSAYHTTLAHSIDLKAGDLVVHLNNGIGKFLGIHQHPDHHGIQNEYLHIAYAEGATLYVPLQQAHLVTKYIGATDALPSLHTLGGQRWKKVRETTQQAIVGYAKDLLKLYAQRQLKSGWAVPADSHETAAFEAEFPFVETEDQLKAIAAVKEDMQAARPMDRLICGDVGYGKTEVAMRAAFKAVVDGAKQVVILVPTTVLAIQHYENFKERMRNYPVRVELLTRFNNAKATKSILEGLKNGTVDIVIGTHRMLSKDVILKNLGLIIIDEEQRFGVRAKEHLKKMKVDVDCLTLSATPIPRTLYMSLLGARDMSVIGTPPEDRLPITTIIAESSDEVIKTALLRELARDGQAFVIHNRIDSIYLLSERLRGLLPHAHIAVAHGQMEPHELDAIFHAFRLGDIDILVATTIIENGIDIPNANTILIDRADSYGLATLYQMRGRVGRWNRRAYAYLLVRDIQALREEGRERLHALIETAGFGGGMKVAMRDLEIRGAGNFLGTEQSGHVATIGYHFYCKLLKRTVEALQGKQPYLHIDIRVEFPLDARLPSDYVNETSLRLEIYQRLGDSMSCAEVDTLFLEIRDRFGPPPIEVLWLYRLARVKLQAAALGYISLRWEKMSLITEKKHGDKVISEKFSFKPCDNPEQWEKMLLGLL